MSDSSRDATPALTCFDEYAALAFSTLCHLTTGDHRRALDLTVAAFAHHLPATGGVSAGAAVVTAAHRAFRSAGASPSNSTPGSAASPLAALSTLELAVIDLRVSAQMTTEAAALVLDGGMTGSDVETIESDVLASLRAATFGQPVGSMLRATEIWFDDDMRERCRSDLVSELGASPVVTGQGRTPAPVRRSRSFVAAAALVIVFALVAVVVAVSTGDDEDVAGGPSARGEATTTTTTTTTTIERRSEKDPSELPDPATAGPNTVPATEESAGNESAETTQASRPYPATDAFNYVLDAVPDGFVAAGAGATSGHGTAWLEVWARPGSTRSEGRWFAITVVDARFGAAPVLQNGTRASDGNGTTTISASTDDGVSYTDERRADGSILRFETFGFDPARLRQLIDATDVTARGDVEHSLTFADAVDLLEPLWSGWSDENGFATRVGVANRQAFYRSTDGAREIEVRTADQAVNDIAVARLLTPSPGTTARMDEQRMVVLGDRGALVASAEDAPDAPAVFGVATPTGEKLSVQFHTAGRTITLIARLPLDELIELARGMRPASVEEWSTFRRAVAPATTDGRRFGFHLSTIGSTVTTLGDTWSIGLIDIDEGALALEQMHSARPASTESTSPGVGTFITLHPDPDRPLLEFASFDATIVAVVLEGPTSAVALRITVDGQQPVDIPLTQVDEPALTGAAHVFSEFAGYTAVLVDADGAVIDDVTPGR